MQFEIGHKPYTVARRWQLTIDGDRCRGLTLHKTHQILLDGDLPDSELLDVLRHEHFHAWEYVVGFVRHNEEQRARFHEMVTGTFERDFAAGGGLDAVLALPIEGEREQAPQKRGIPNTPMSVIDRRSCGCCGTEVAAGSIASGKPIEIAPQTFVLDRWMVCPCCSGLTKWRERCDTHGIPNGGIVSAEVLTGRAALDYAEAHAAEAARCVFNVA